MALVIESPHAEYLIHTLAELRSETPERVLVHALEANLAAERSKEREIPARRKTPEEIEAGVVRLMKLAEEFRANTKIEPFNYDDWLYDEHGLPRDGD